MKRFSALAALALVAALGTAPALARSNYVIDQAQMLSPQAIAQINTEAGNLNAQTGKEIVVQTVSSLGGVPVRDAAAKAFSDQAVNGVLIFIAKDDRKDFIVPDRAGTQAGWFSPSIVQPIYDSMAAQFKNENYDAGVTTAVESILGIYRSHMGSLGAANGAPAPAGRQNTSYANYPATGGFHLSMFWLIVLLVVAFLVLRSILRAVTAPRPPAGYGGPPVAPGGYTQGYGPGYGGMGGGGSFFSGLLGGLGGAFLGNELFRGGGGSLGGGTDQGGSWGGGASGPGDAGGWTSDAGQGDAGGGGGGGDWSGGGFDGGGGDFGGGGGGDSGGGW